MKKSILNIAFILGLGLTAFVASCSDQDEEIKTATFDQLFSPTNLEAKIQSKTNVKLQWNAVTNAESYTVELYVDENLTFNGTPKTYEGITDNNFTIKGLLGETQYTARVKAISSKLDESKWYAVAFMTEAENIFNAVKNEDIEAHAVTLTWDAVDASATKIVISADGKDSKTYNLTSTDITNKQARIDQLDESTAYTAKLYNGDKLRGTITFKTAIDFSGKTPVYEGEDLVAVLNSAEDGASIVLVSGSFVIGNYELNKSITISGYDKTNMPTVYGRLQPSGTISSIEINNVIFRGDVPDAEANTPNFIEFVSGAKLSTLTVSGCEIRNYKDHIIYNNASAVLGTVLIENCWVDRAMGSGGDGFDIRSGSLTQLTIQNSTFSNGIRTFIRCNLTAANITVKNCTFYKVCIDGTSNNNGLFLMDKVNADSGKLNVEKCVFSNVGNGVYGYWSKTGKMKATATYSKNYFYASPNLWDATNGFYKDPSACSATEINPLFTDPDNGDFTVKAEDIKDAKAGDPRWIKE